MKMALVMEMAMVIIFVAVVVLLAVVMARQWPVGEGGIADDAVESVESDVGDAF